MEALGLQGLLEHNTNSKELPTEINPPPFPVSNPPIVLHSQTTLHNLKFINKRRWKGEIISLKGFDFPIIQATLNPAIPLPMTATFIMLLSLKRVHRISLSYP